MRREQVTALSWAALFVLVITSPLTVPMLAFMAGRWTA